MHWIFGSGEYPTFVFFNLSAAAEPSANVCVAHGTLCEGPSLHLAFCNKPMARNVASMLYFYISAEPLAGTRGTLRFGGAPSCHVFAKWPVGQK